jgi:hypothetical protein
MLQVAVGTLAESYANGRLTLEAVRQMYVPDYSLPPTPDEEEHLEHFYFLPGVERTDLLRRILIAIRRGGPTEEELADVVGVSTERVRQELAPLLGKTVVLADGRYGGLMWLVKPRRWWQFWKW